MRVSRALVERNAGMELELVDVVLALSLAESCFVRHLPEVDSRDCELTSC